MSILTVNNNLHRDANVEQNNNIISFETILILL